MNRYALHTLIGVTTTCVVFILLATIGSGFAQESDPLKEIDVVWSQSDGIRPEIFYTSRAAGNWSEPEMVTDDYYDNMHPVIDRDSNGVRWLFWSAYDSQRTEIRYTSGSSGEWQGSGTLADTMAANNAPSVVIGKDDTIWVVWAGNDGGLDDIYYASGVAGKFSETNRLHGPNESPDVLPVVELNENDLPVVSWKQMQEGRYVTVRSEFDGSAWSEPVTVQEEEQQGSASGSEEMIELPEFVTNSGLVFIRSY